MLLSFVVPAYNVEKYFLRCINSIYDQNLQAADFEVVVMDDGSTDGTGILAEELKRSNKYSNLNVIHQENQGLSGARNAGINHAKGDYIWCIDSDDYLKPFDIDEIIKSLKKVIPDILFIELQKTNGEGGIKKECSQPLEKNKLYTGFEAILGGYYPCSACSAIIRREFIQANKLSFYPRLYHEDVEFMYRAVALANKVIFTDYAPYVYEVHPNTIMTDMDERKVIKRLADNAIIANSLNSFAHIIKDEKVKKRIIEQSRSIAMGTINELRTNKNLNENIKNNVVNKFRELNFFPLKTPSWTVKRVALSLILNLQFAKYGK